MLLPPSADYWALGLDPVSHFPHEARVKRLFLHRRGEERRESRGERRGEERRRESRGHSREERTQAGKSVNVLPHRGQDHLPISIY